MNMYGCTVAASVLVAGSLFAALLPHGKRWAAPLVCGLSSLMGFMMSRLVFWLCSASLYLIQCHDAASLFRISEGGLSMTGALIGAGVGCWVSSLMLRGSGLSFRVLADALAPSAALFIACERCHEWPLLAQNYGLDMEKADFWTVNGAYGPLMNTGRISALVALAIMAVLLLIRIKQKGDRALLFMVLYGTLQTLLESLRQDQHMTWGFVRAQQLFACLTAAAGLILLSKWRRGTLAALLASLMLAGAITFLEFALDGRIPVPFEFMRINTKLSWYIVFIAVLAGYLAYSMHVYRLRDKDEVL